MNQIKYGKKVFADSKNPPDVWYNEDKIVSANVNIGDSLPAAELSVDTLTANVLSHDTQQRLLGVAPGFFPRFLAAENTFLAAAREDRPLSDNYNYGDKVEYSNNGTLVGKFRIENIERTGKYAFKINAVSDVGLLLSGYHYGGIYKGTALKKVLDEIIGGVVPYTIDSAFASTPVYGWLKKATRRDNLRDLLFAVGGVIRKDVAGEIVIEPMSERTSYDIDASQVYVGGSVTGGNPATGVDVTEHAFHALASDAETTLYDGEAVAEIMQTPKGKTVEGVLVEFPQPYHSLFASNCELLESGANYAVISSSPAASLVGKPYTHTERVVSRRVYSNKAPNIARETACTLVNPLNVDLVADRLMAYYSAGKNVSADLVITNQKPGDAVTLVDPFGDRTSGYIAGIDITVSKTLKGKSTIVSGYIPGGSGNYYSNLAVITSNGTWVVPENNKGKIRFVLVGGGDGGYCGRPGEDGFNGSSGRNGNSGSGGVGGKGGAGGKIFVGTINVETGQEFRCVIGSGGIGEVSLYDGDDYVIVPAEPGTATVFGGYSSESGLQSPNGIAALVTSDVYGIAGESGISGGAGQKSDYSDRPAVTYKGQTWIAGSEGNDERDGSNRALGGCGGGAAVGSHGNDGGDGYLEYNPDGTVFVNGGDGGDGADGAAGDSATIPGAGGNGGHGGGGGGGAGGAVGDDNRVWDKYTGRGGLGGDGGSGADGIILIYY